MAQITTTPVVRQTRFLAVTGAAMFLAISTEISGNSQATAVGMLGASNQMGGVGGEALGGAFLALGGFSTVGFFCLGTVLLSAVVLQFGMSGRPSADKE
ncbi:MAG: hypothetical protein CL696_05685 [Chloroflexi bacterium]|nr:hypothetical protein [Chloroflexota bacterium]MDP6497855.1 hypothetical protein [Dehalococcoidia bacterium]MQG54119.1 hypothetical protein [SAR202 cluster bacterium]